MAVATDTVTITTDSDTNTRTYTFTNYGPLTTVFTPPASCAASKTGTFQFINDTDPSAPTSYYDCNALTLTNNAWEFKYVGDPNCMPYGSLVSSIYSSRYPYEYVNQHSPGIYCPSGWGSSGIVTYSPGVTTTSIGISGIGISGDGQYPSWQTDAMPTGGTQVFCCPSSWSLQNFYCSSQVTTATFGVYCDLEGGTISNISGTLTTIWPTSLSGFDWVPSETASTLGYIVPPIVLVHQTSDLPRTQTPTLPPTQTPTVHNKALSMDAKIAIGVVVPIAVIAALLFGMCLVLRRRKRKQRSTSAGPDAPAHANGRNDERPPAFEVESKTAAFGVREPENIPISPTSTAGRSLPQSPEMKHATRFNPYRAASPMGTDMSAGSTVQGTDNQEWHQELENTGRAELGYSTRSANEFPSPLQPGQSSPEPRPALGAYDNEMFERYPSPSDRPKETEAFLGPTGGSRLATMQNESAQLDDQIKRFNLEELVDQKRRVDAKIAAMQAKKGLTA